MNQLAAALVLSMLSGDVLAAHAQPATQTVDQVPPSADLLRASVPEIKKAILAATGNDDNTVKLVATDMDFVVTLLDSKLASGSSTARESEASKIASVIADAISGKEEFKGILAIHVDYATRKAEGSSPRTMDKIDFRRDSQGQFMHHAS